MSSLIQKVCIGVPVFNDVLFIKKCLDSLLNQSYKNIEILISDDHSTDGSEEICKIYSSNYSNVKYFRQEKNLGISKNMEFLLDNCTSEFFMWAANDDEWSPRFIESLIQELLINEDAVVSFGPYVYISESGEKLSGLRIENFSANSSKERLRKLINSPSDGFGYGLFRTNKIRGVKFPRWAWPNHKCAYNNIYPTLVYYLSQGQYIYVESDEPLWLNRIKTEQNINHKIPFKTSGFLLCYSAFMLRKFNLVFFSIFLLMSSKKNFILIIEIFPRLFFSWFLIPVFLNAHLKYKAYKEKRFEVFI
jgi:glycosyltransferase involved in cell wall biosynthesis